MGKDFLFNTTKEGSLLSDKLGLRKDYNVIHSADKVLSNIGKQNFEWNWMDSNVSASVSAYTTHIFKFSTDIISDYSLEITTDNSAVWDVGRMALYGAIDEVTIKCGKDICKYSGEALALYVQQLSYTDTKKNLFMDLSDFGGADINNATLFVPLNGPGSDCFGDSQPIDCSQLKNDFEIQVRLKPGNIISKTNALVIPTIKLRYKNWTVDEKSKVLLNKVLFLDISSYNKYTFVSGGTEAQIRIDQHLSDKQVVSMGLIFVNTTNHNTEFEYLQGSIVTNMEVNVNNKKIYEHNSQQEAKFKNLLAFETNNEISQTALSYYYNIPFISNFNKTLISGKIFGQDGIKLYNSIPTLKATLAAATYLVTIVNISQAALMIDNGIVKILY